MRLIDANAFKAFPLAGRPYSGAKLKAYARGAKTVLAAIDAAPTIDPESLRPTAHWITCKYHPKFKCSRCASSHFAPRKFCPECGARMIYTLR